MPQKLVVLIVCLLLSAEAFPAGEEELQTRTFDVSALLDARTDPPVGRIGFGDAFTGWDDEEEMPDEAGFLDTFALEDLVRRVVSPREWSMDGCEIDWAGETRLQVTATPEMLDAVGELLGDLFLLAARRVEIRAELVTFDAAGAERLAAAGIQSALARGRLDAAARKAALAEAGKPGGSVEAGTISIRPGALAALAQTSSVAYVGDMDVEIAQGSVVGDPIVRFATEGWLLNARPYLLSDGSVWLEAVQQRASFPEPMRHVNPEATPLGTIDFPVVAQERFFAAGRVAKGETMAVYRRVPGGANTLVALLLTPVVLGDEPEDGAARFLPTAALTTRRLGAGSGWDSEFSGEWSAVPAPTRAAFLSSPSMLLLKSEPPLPYPDALHADLDAPIVVGTSGLFTTSPAAAATLGERIAKRERISLRSHDVRMELTDERGQFVTEVRLEVPYGRPAFFESGVTRAFLADWDVEVAQESRVGDPIIGHAFGGFLANLRLEPSPDGGKIAGRLAMAVVELSPEFETRRTGNELTGIIEIPRAKQTMLEHEFVTNAGAPVTIDGGRYRLTVTATPR